MKKLSRFKHSFWPGIILLLIVTYLLCLPGSRLPHGGWLDKIPIDKIVHVCIFATLFLCWFWPLSRKHIPAAAMWVFFIGLVYGIAMEFVQHYFVPGRSFEVEDMIADAGGLLTGFVIGRVMT